MTPSPLKVKQNLWGAYIDITRTLFMTQFYSFSFPFFTVPLREQLAAMIIYHDGSCFC